MFLQIKNQKSSDSKSWNSKMRTTTTSMRDELKPRILLFSRACMGAWVLKGGQKNPPRGDCLCMYCTALLVLQPRAPFPFSHVRCMSTHSCFHHRLIIPLQKIPQDMQSCVHHNLIFAIELSSAVLQI